MATGREQVLLNNVAATGVGPRVPCQVDFGFGPVHNACTTFTVDVSTTGSPASFSITIQGGINEQGTATTIGSAVVAAGLHQVTITTPVTYWQANLTAVSGGTSPTVRVVGVSQP